MLVDEQQDRSNESENIAKGDPLEQAWCIFTQDRVHNLVQSGHYDYNGEDIDKPVGDG